MKLTPATFLYGIKNLVVGTGKADATGLKGADGGYNQDYALALGDATLGSTSVIGLDAANLHVISTAVSSTNGSTNTFGTWGFLVPRDYDQNTDQLKVRFIAAMSGNTDTPTVTVASSTQALTSTGSTYGAITAGSTVTTAAISSTISMYEVDLSGMGLVRDTIVAIKISTSLHNTDKAQLYNVELVYASCLVAFSEATNTAGKAVGYDVLGNPLR